MTFAIYLENLRSRGRSQTNIARKSHKGRIGNVANNRNDDVRDFDNGDQSERRDQRGAARRNSSSSGNEAETNHCTVTYATTAEAGIEPVTSRIKYDRDTAAPERQS